MFWSFVKGITHLSISISHTCTALGVAVIASVGVYDYLKARNDAAHKK